MPLPPEHQGKAKDWANQVRHHLHNQDFDLLAQDATLFKPETVERWPDNRVKHCSGTSYKYDTWGNRVETVRLDGKTQRYAYDGQHQLIQVDCFENGELVSTTRYRYDALGRRLSKATKLKSSQAQQTVFYGWDGDRIVHSETEDEICATVYEPDSFVPMLMVTNKKPGHVQLPEELQQVQKQFPELFVELVQSGNLPLASREELQKLGFNATDLTQQLTAIQEAEKARRDQSLVSIHHICCDHLGTPRALFDNCGVPVWLAEYDDWGNIVQEYNPLNFNQPIRFQGQYEDKESGLFYNYRRYYDPNLGRYLNQDPIGLLGGENLYAYPLNPLQWIDPTGLLGKEDAQAKVDAIREDGTGVRLGGAKASLGKVEVKGVVGEKKIGPGKANAAAVKPSKGIGVSIGKPCTEKEIAVSPWSWKYWEKKIGGEGTVKGTASVQGPGVTVDPVCVDPAQVTKAVAAEGVNAVLNNDGYLGRAVNATSNAGVAIDAAVDRGVEPSQPAPTQTSTTDPATGISFFKK